MDFELTPRQNELRKRAREFCSRECPPEFETALDEEGGFPEDLYKKMASSGLLGIPFPEAYGGGGGDILDIVLVTEQLASSSYTAVNMFLVNTVFAGMIILNCGSDEQKNEFIPKLARGDLRFSFALTEPDAGSDARSIRTFAVDRDGHFSITGTKYWTTGANVADYIITVALTGDNADPSRPMSVFIVPARSEGLTARPIPKLAGKAFPSCEVTYSDVQVDRALVLGGVQWLGQGLVQLFQTAEYERVCVAASCIGGADAILTECTDFAKARIQFNKPIIKFQAIQHALADMATQLEAMRWMTYHAAWMKAKGKDCFKEICMAKLFCSEMLADIAKRGMQIMGGRGYSLEHRMQRFLRESYLSLYAGGTSEIQKNVIARFL